MTRRLHREQRTVPVPVVPVPSGGGGGGWPNSTPNLRPLTALPGGTKAGKLQGFCRLLRSPPRETPCSSARP
uniref:Uncharacterized protein n=1 Tax=Anopheles albimanus TaxID=7167 RepID=A0A182FJ14_ANOAL